MQLLCEDHTYSYCSCREQTTDELRRAKYSNVFTTTNDSFGPLLYYRVFNIYQRKIDDSRFLYVSHMKEGENRGNIGYHHKFPTSMFSPTDFLANKGTFMGRKNYSPIIRGLRQRE